MSMLIDGSLSDGTRSTAAHARPRRGPRPEEIALMRGLADGPKVMTSGPIGRCVKRGWCRASMAEGGQRRTIVLFVLTDAGRALLADD
jgi:hypothetical protein